MHNYDKQNYDNLGDKLPTIDWKQQELKPFDKDFYKVRTLSTYGSDC